MPRFLYQARNKEGQLVNGHLDVETEDEAVGRIFSLGLTLISLNEETQKASESTDNDIFKGRVTDKDLVFFSRQLASLLKAGVPIIDSLSSISNQAPSKALKEKINEALINLREGMTLSECLAKYPKEFPELLVAMLRVGEISGRPSDALERFSILKSDQMELSSKVLSIMIYPIVLVIASIGIVGFLVVFIMPKFDNIFNSFGADLPLPTKILLGFSNFIRQDWMFLVAGVVGFGFWVKSFLSTEKGRHSLDSILMKLPTIGDFYSKVTLAPLFHTLADLLNMGVPLLEALRVVEGTIFNTVIRRAIVSIRESITHGVSLSQAFNETGAFSTTVIQMVIVGEKSGSLSEMLLEISGFYHREVTYAIRNVTALIEPILLLGMGATVGFIALAVLLPVFNMSKLMRH